MEVEAAAARLENITQYLIVNPADCLFLGPRDGELLGHRLNGRHERASEVSCHTAEVLLGMTHEKRALNVHTFKERRRYRGRKPYVATLELIWPVLAPGLAVHSH